MAEEVEEELKVVKEGVENNFLIKFSLSVFVINFIGRMDHQGFAKLKGFSATHYLQKLSVTLGRSSLKKEVQIELGHYRNISRKHAKISFNFTTKQFEILCMGKNGIKVDNKNYTSKSPPIPLIRGSEVQIGDSFFIFLLPKGNFSNFMNITQEDDEVTTTFNKSSIENVLYEKPSFSYSTMIAQALSSQTEKKMTLQEIYQWIMDQYPYFKVQESGWKSSVRHNLSLSKYFSRVEDNSKRAVYQLNPEMEEELLNGTAKNSKKKKLDKIEPKSVENVQKKVKLE